MADDAFIVHPEVKKMLEGQLIKMLKDDYTLDIERATRKGDNYLGILARITIKGTYKKGERKLAKLNWIIKSAPQADMYRLNANAVIAYEREILMYKQVFPTFKKFQEEKCAMNPFESYPRFYISSMEPYQESIILEDMKSHGYIMKNRKEPLDYNHVRLVMQTYGRLHAISYAIKDQKPEEFRRISENVKENFFSTLNTKYLVQRETVKCKKVLNAFNVENHKDIMLKYEKYMNKFICVVLETIEESNEDKYSVVCHGDSWVNNMLFKYDNVDKPDYPTDICLLDFQLSRYGSPAFDLSYFIFTCTSKALRDERYDQMIRTYYYSLCAHMIDLGSDPEKLLPFIALESQLKRYSILGLFFSQLVMNLMLSEAEEIPDISAKQNEENIIPSFSKNDELFVERIKDVVTDFYNKGYLDIID